MSGHENLDRQGLLMVAGGALILGLVAGLVLWLQLRTPQLDPDTLQAIGKPITGEVVVLLDVTDPLSPGARRAFTPWLRGLEQTLVPNERVTLWVLGTGPDGILERAFDRYYPGRETDRLFHNPEESAARCDSLFSRPLREAVTKAATEPRHPRSPILEAAREITGQPEFSEARPRAFVLISDLTENTSTLNFYRAVPSYAAFARLPEARRFRADLHGVEVDVLYVARGRCATTLDSSLRDFWHDYLLACGAASVRIQRL